MSRRNFDQPSLADAFVKAYSRAGGFLEGIAETFEWAAFDVLMRPLHSSSDGAPAYPPLTMLMSYSRCLKSQHTHERSR